MKGIIPTLIVVRMGLGIHTEDVQTVISVSGIRFEQGEIGSGQAGQTGTHEYVRAPAVV